MSDLVEIEKQEEIERRQDFILDFMSMGYSLNTICTKLNTQSGVISSSEVFRMLNKNADFRDKYVHARAQQALFYAEKMQETIEALPKYPTREEIDKAKLSIETDKFISAKMLPKVYGPPATGPTVLINTQPITGMKILDVEHEEIE